MVSWILDEKFNQKELESQWRREYEDGFLKIVLFFQSPIMQISVLNGIKTSARSVKRQSTSLAIREMQIKTTMRYHYTCIRITTIKNSDNTKC